MKKIIKLISKTGGSDYPNLWDYYTVLCKFTDNKTGKTIQMEVTMYPEEYEANMIRQEIEEKYPELMPKIDKMTELYRQHEQNETCRSEAD